jgi:hypothetical protein
MNETTCQWSVFVILITTEKGKHDGAGSNILHFDTFFCFNCFLAAAWGRKVCQQWTCGAFTAHLLFRPLFQTTFFFCSIVDFVTRFFAERHTT